MRYNISNLWPFSASTPIISDGSEQSLTRVKRHSSWYQSIHDLPLRIFINCLVEDNLSLLIITGTPTPDQLEDAWEKISDEYTTALGDNEFKLCLILQKEVAQLTTSFKLVHYAVGILQMVYYKELAEELNKLLGTAYHFDVKNPKAYKRELQLCLSKAKQYKMKLDIKSKNLEVIESKQKGKSQKPTKAYFQSILISLSDHAKYAIPDTITVYEYCERIRRLNQYVEQTKKKVR